LVQFDHVARISAAMQLVLQIVLNIPFSDWTKGFKAAQKSKKIKKNKSYI